MVCIFTKCPTLKHKQIKETMVNKMKPFYTSASVLSASNGNLPGLHLEKPAPGTEEAS